MFILKSEVEFDMAHYLKGYEGKCKNIHGHRYRLVAKFKSPKLKEEGQTRGMVEDFSVLKKALKEISDYFDHKLMIEDTGKQKETELIKALYDFDVVQVPYRPTAEEMARHIYQMLKEQALPIWEVELFETPTNSCIYREED
jgi:6-pyruvoyltetrahydropterin/6-carboxytetrahydropterin synthase